MGLVSNFRRHTFYIFDFLSRVSTADHSLHTLASSALGLCIVRGQVFPFGQLALLFPQTHIQYDQQESGL